jgi:signal transduction histidine kinase/CheY-like chemotaxis protein
VKDALAFLQNADAAAFVLLGVATGAAWARRRNRSLGFLALAIVLLSMVSVLGRVPPRFVPFVPQLTLFFFMGSAYALLRFRGSLIPLSPRWHRAAVVAMVVALLAFTAAEGLTAVHAVPAGVLTALGLALILVWAATVVEPSVRFWVVARNLPAVQAWRLRSLTLGFGGLVAILAFALAASAFRSDPGIQVLIQVLVLLIVPLLYVSFSPPAWLRRQWRSSEEECLRIFMQDMLVLGEDQATLADRALEWAMRLVGGAAAVAFESSGRRFASRGLDANQLSDLERRIPQLSEGVSRTVVDDVDQTLFVLPIAGSVPPGHLVVLSGPFTPSFGGDESSRVQQFMTAVAAALERGRLLERVKQTNAELVDANHHKTVFLANMSHELRTPLNAILGFSELMIDTANDQFPEATRKRFLEQIHSSGKHLLGLINDVLDLSKIEAGQMELRLQMVGVAEVIAAVASTVEPLAAPKHIALEAKTDGAGQILADEGKLRQMILNLVSNAIKFTPDGGVVKVEARRAADRLEISVTDNGIGIAPEDIQRVFKQFQQVDSEANRAQQGTGLGLALTRSFAILHGGEVRVESELGSGSRFTIDLPIETQRPDRAPAVTAGDEGTAEVDVRRPLVVVVEDDPVAAELLARQIERAGFRTEVARTGADAIAMAKEHKPAALTLDILLPDIDGWEVLTLLKRDEATSGIPVVVVSAVDNPTLGAALGALDYFVKPVEPNELINRLTNHNFKKWSGARKTTVLVVDDEAANRDLLKQVLEAAGFTAILAGGGREGIDLARSEKPDVVMLDLLMPEVDGFDVLEALKEHEATRSIPVMILTAKHLSKVDIERLNRRVATILKRGSTGSVELLGQLRAILEERPVGA